MRLVHIVIANILWVALYIQVGRVIIRWVYLDRSYRYRLIFAHIVDNVKLVFAWFAYFQIIDVAVLIQIEVIDLVCRIVNGFFQHLRIGAGFNQAGQFVYIKAGSGIALYGYIVLLWWLRTTA